MDILHFVFYLLNNGKEMSMLKNKGNIDRKYHYHDLYNDHDHYNLYY